MELFKEATKQSLRFNLGNGEVTTEDLWHYGLERLDSLYSTIHQEIENSKQASLLKPKTNASKLLELKLAIVKDIVETKLADKQAKDLKELKANKARIAREKLANKQDAALDDLSEEDLEKYIKSLEE